MAFPLDDFLYSEQNDEYGDYGGEDDEDGEHLRSAYDQSSTMSPQSRMWQRPSVCI